MQRAIDKLIELQSLAKKPYVEVGGDVALFIRHDLSEVINNIIDYVADNENDRCANSDHQELK